MNIAKSDLYRLILEEYLLEEGRGDEAAEDLLKKILGDKYQTPEERDPVRHAKHDGSTAPMEQPHTDVGPEAVPAPDETFALEEPPAGRPKLSAQELAATISELIHGRDPQEVSEIFQLAFEKLPGVELSSPGDEDYPEEKPSTEYGGEEYELRQKQMPIGFEESFELKELMSLIKEVMDETEWFDISAGETAPSHQTDAVEPQELIQRIENAYHDLQDAFEELPDEIAHEMGRKIILDIETLMDTTEHPEDYRE